MNPPKGSDPRSIDARRPRSPGKLRTVKRQPPQPTAIIVCVGPLLAALFGCSGLPLFGSVARPATDAVPTRPGAAAWSPDGKRVAHISGESLVVRDVATGHTTEVGGVVPRYLDWAPGHDLLVVDASVGDRRVIRFDPPNGGIETLDPAPQSPVAVRWLVPDQSVMVVSASGRAMSIGIVAEATLSRVDARGSSTLLQWSLVLPTRRQSVDFTTGWSYAGPRPVTETWLVPELHAPPRFEPYLRFIEVDPANGDTVERFRTHGRHRYTAAASWSSDGTRLALTDAVGRLAIFDAASGRLTTPDRSADSAAPPGHYPSWSPRGDLVHLGGCLLDPNGELVRCLRSDAPEAIGVWSPDGAQIALLHAGELVVHAGPAPAGPAPADLIRDDSLSTLRDKLRLLVELHLDGLIEDEDYRARRRRLIETSEPWR